MNRSILVVHHIFATYPGSIPDWLSNLVALTMLDLSCNGFTGEMPVNNSLDESFHVS
ncbi:MAG: hypothetical protein ABJQ90_16295 [Parasphingorhabdus sp.]